MVQAIVHQIKQVCQAWNWVIDLVEISKNDSKDIEIT